MLQELVTPKGYRFWGESLVTIDGVDYPLDELTGRQRSYVLAVRDVNALNAAYAGRAEFRAEGLPAFEEVFPEIAEARSRREQRGWTEARASGGGHGAPADQPETEGSRALRTGGA